ncbi:hypothetical protein BSKO_10957 [Bryopsis sp. KO-2023]|nr:hypothetical protein BSKO_10957 [Bryopsis sp. KO-2023]
MERSKSIQGKRINPVGKERKVESDRILTKYPDRIPVFVEKYERSDVPDDEKKKYLVPSDLLVGQFMYVIRKRIKLSSEKAIFIFVKNFLPASAASMLDVYQEHKDPDGFLYITYSGESTLSGFEPRGMGSATKGDLLNGL